MKLNLLTTEEQWKFVGVTNRCPVGTSVTPCYWGSVWLVVPLCFICGRVIWQFCEYSGMLWMLFFRHHALLSVVIGVWNIVSISDSVYRNILDNPELRTQVINELHELAAFLQRRLEEQSTDHMASDLLNIQLGDTQLLNNKKTVSQMTQSVRELLELFDDQRLQALCKLHDSATYGPSFLFGVHHTNNK